MSLAGAAHLAKLAKSEETRAAAGPALLLCQLVLSEQPAPSKARYPPVPPSSTLKISSVFVQLGVVDALRQRLSEAADQLKPSGACEANHTHVVPKTTLLSQVLYVPGTVPITSEIFCHEAVCAARLCEMQLRVG